MAGFLDRSAPGEILNRWKSMSPSVRREAAEVLFSEPEGIEALLGAVESRSLASSEIDLGRLQQLETHSNSGFRSRARRSWHQEPCRRGIVPRLWPTIGERLS